MLTSLHTFVFSKRAEHLILGLIVLNALVLTLETLVADTSITYQILKVVDKTLLGIFCLEIGAKIILTTIVQGLRPTLNLFKDGWFDFDVIVVVIAFAPGLGALRSLRLLRLLPRIPAFKHLSEQMGVATLHSLPILGMLLFVGMILTLIGWHGGHDSAPELFGTLLNSFYAAMDSLVIEGMPDARDALRAQNEVVGFVYWLISIIGSILILSFVVAAVVDANNIHQQKTA